MKRKITDNIPLKIMSLAVAVLVWLIVVNIDNPMETQYYTVSNVEIINKDYIESPETGGKMCLPEVDQGSTEKGAEPDQRFGHHRNSRSAAGHQS